MAIFALLYPDPDCQSWYGSRSPIESGSNPDPDLIRTRIYNTALGGGGGGGGVGGSNLLQEAP